MPRDGLWLALIVLLIGAALWALSRYTQIGLVTRAAAENEKGRGDPRVLSRLLGGPQLRRRIGRRRVRRNSGRSDDSARFVGVHVRVSDSWPRCGPDRQVPQCLADIVHRLAIGMVQSTFTKLQSDLSWFPQYGAREGLPFLVIIVAMVSARRTTARSRGRRQLETASGTRRESDSSRTVRDARWRSLSPRCSCSARCGVARS